MEIRKFDPETDYVTCTSWWRKHSWPAVPLDLLPKTGLMVEDNGVKLAAGWLYLTDSRFAVLEWVVGNPEASKYDRSTALDLLLISLKDAAKEAKVTTIFTSTEHQGLIDRYRGHGFIETDQKMTNLIARIS